MVVVHDAWIACIPETVPLDSFEAALDALGLGDGVCSDCGVRVGSHVVSWIQQNLKGQHSVGLIRRVVECICDVLALLPDLAPPMHHEKSPYVAYSVPGRVACVLDDIPMGAWSMCEEVKCAGLEQVDVHVARALLENKVFSRWATLEQKVNAIRDLFSVLEVPDVRDDKEIEKERVETCVLTEYDVNERYTHRVKFSDITAKVECAVDVPTKDVIAFRVRLASYLIGLGLTKKRMADGMYYVGLKPRTRPSNPDEFQKVSDERLRMPLHPSVLTVYESLDRHEGRECHDTPGQPNGYYFFGGKLGTGEYAPAVPPCFTSSNK